MRPDAAPKKCSTSERPHDQQRAPPKRRVSRHQAREPPIKRIVPLAVLTLTLLLATEAKAKLSPQTIAYWQKIHRCEQPAGWGMVNRYYPGGLGISVGAWNWWAGELGLLKRYPNGAVAPMLVQIQVADYGWRVHRGMWTSMSRCGYPPG